MISGRVEKSMPVERNNEERWMGGVWKWHCPDSLSLFPTGHELQGSNYRQTWCSETSADYTWRFETYLCSSSLWSTKTVSSQIYSELVQNLKLMGDVADLHYIRERCTEKWRITDIYIWLQGLSAFGDIIPFSNQ